MFVTLEGPEGSGKSTLARGLASRLVEAGYEPLVTREPGSGPVGSQIRDILLHGGHLTQLSELFLFLADRAQHVEDVIKPDLAKGIVVVCDRHADSTVVYQGHARGLELDWLRGLNSRATGGLEPDLTLLLDIEPSLGLRRIRKLDRLDQEPLAFHEKVRSGFLFEAGREQHRWAVVDASMSQEAVLAQCWTLLLNRLRRP